MDSIVAGNNQFEMLEGDGFKPAKEIHVTLVCDTALKGNEYQCESNTVLEPEVSDDCDITVEKVENLAKSGQLGIQDDLKCTECDRNFKSQVYISGHTKCHEKEKHECNKCGKEFLHKSALKLHILREENIRNFKCPHPGCPYKAVRVHDLQKHLPSHDEVPKFVCKYCQKALLTRSRLQHHIKYNHAKSEQFSCEKCPFVTLNKESLRRHVIVKHTDSELYKCPVCHVVIKQAGTFKVHMRIHLEEKPFVCNECGSSFRSSSQLAAHRKIHGDKNFICSQCARGFKTRHHLIRHEIIHTNVKPYSCEICNYSCNVKANLAKHMKGTHNIFDYSTAKPKKILIDDENEDNPERKRGEEFANMILQEFSGRSDEEITFDTLRNKHKTNEEMKRTKIETAKLAFLEKYGDRTAGRRQKSRYNFSGEIGSPALEHGVVVIKSNDKNMPKTIAVDEATGAIVPMSSRTETYKNSVADDNVMSNTIIQFDECTGQIYQFDTNSLENGVVTDEVGNQIAFGDTTLQFKNHSLDLNDDIPLVIDSSNSFTVSTLNCDVLDDNCSKIMSMNKCDGTKGDSQIVFIIKEPE